MLEGGRQGVLDCSSISVSGERAHFALPARGDWHGAAAETGQDGHGHAAKDGRHLAGAASEGCFPAEAIQFG